MADTPLRRRDVLGGMGLSAMALAGLGAAAPGRAEAPRRTLAYLGGFTSSGGRGLDVAALGADGRLEPLGQVAGVSDASFLAFSHDQQVLYATREADDGHVVALSLADPERPALLNEQSTRGAKPTHLSVHGGHLLTANYESGSIAVHALRQDGSIGESTDLVQHTGTDRAPHAHQVITDPAGQLVIAVDLGADSVYTYSFADGRLTEEQRLRLATGSGPRHLVPHPDGTHAYVLAELDSTITVLTRDGRGFTSGQVLSSRGPRATGQNAGGEIVLSADGQYVHATNRGDNTVATFAVRDDGARLEPLGAVPTGGDWPRHCTLAPDESALYVANERSATITRLARDRTGHLAPATEAAAVPAVAMIAFRD